MMSIEHHKNSQHNFLEIIQFEHLLFPTIKSLICTAKQKPYFAGSEEFYLFSKFQILPTFSSSDLTLFDFLQQLASETVY